MHLSLSLPSFPLRRDFIIARGRRQEARTLCVTLRDGDQIGRGESLPYAHYGEDIPSVCAHMDAIRPHLAGLTREKLQGFLPAGAARNALDCALWDLEAKKTGRPAYQQAGLTKLKPILTAFTLSVRAPDEMAKEAALAASHFPILKLKLNGSAQDEARLVRVRQAAPSALLLVDANESWSPESLPSRFSLCARLGVAMIEQPLVRGKDAALAHLPHPVPIYADESVHTCADLPKLKGLYEGVNIKLDKTGGLTHALALRHMALEMGFEIMIGCMLASSLAIAPAFLLTPHARFIDLDPPLLLARDCLHSLSHEEALLFPPDPALWG